MNLTIERNRSTILSDNHKPKDFISLVKTKTGYQSSELETTTDKLVLAAGPVVGLAMIGGSLYSIYKKNYGLAIGLFIASAPVTAMLTLGAFWVLWRNKTNTQENA